MGRWPKDAKEFTVGLGYYEGRGYQSVIPKPIVDLLGITDRITFKVSGKKVYVMSGTD